MDLISILWIYIPISIASFGILLSLSFTISDKSYFNGIASFTVLILNGISMYILIEILIGSWPTFLPHIAILVSSILIVIQFLLSRNRKKRMNNVW